MGEPHRGDGPGRRRSGGRLEMTVERRVTAALRQEVERFLDDHAGDEDHMVPDHLLADLRADALTALVTARAASSLIGCVLVATGADIGRLAVAAPVEVAADLMALGIAEQRPEQPLQWWIHGVPSPLEMLATDHGFTPDRELIQMTCDLPIATTSTVITRGFRPGRDEDAWLAVNNRAFAGHAEQAGWTRETLRRRMDAPWFEPEALRILEVDDEVAAFCWTKIHDEMRPLTGEIYIIAVDPRLHGRGLGREMTCAGLDWLAGRGITRAMLFVDSANAPARALYHHLGFATARHDRSYVRSAIAARPDTYADSTVG